MQTPISGRSGIVAGLAVAMASEAIRAVAVRENLFAASFYVIRTPTRPFCQLRPENCSKKISLVKTPANFMESSNPPRNLSANCGMWESRLEFSPFPQAIFGGH